MSKYFGKTWWGQQWLHSLSNIDYSNRLPRGSAYARNGSVASINIHGNAIKAKVEGSRPEPYDVNIVVPSFTDAEIHKLITAIADKPVIISKLLNRELDPELLQIAETQGLKVFPKQWSDFKMECSCPDWAVPCKHLAAIVYKVSTEIDNNPFIVFELHKVNLPAELEKKNIFIETGSSDVPRLKQLLQPDNSIKKGKKKKATEETTIMSSVTTAVPPLNFSTLQPITDALIQLLADAPVFYQNIGNFRDKYAIALHKVVRNTQRIIAGKVPLSDFFIRHYYTLNTKKQERQKTELQITHHTNICIDVDSNNTYGIWIDDKEVSGSTQQLITQLWQISPAHLQDYQCSIAALRTILLLCVNLLAAGAVVPQIAQLQNEQFAVRWLPALLSNDIHVLMEKLYAQLPKGLLLFNGKEDITHHKKACAITSYFLNDMIRAFSETITGNDVFVDLFFSDHTAFFNEPGQAALPGSINAWLQRYYLTQGKYKPLIIVDEIEDDCFQIVIHIETSDKPLEKPVALRDVLTLKKFDTVRFEMLNSFAHLSTFIPGVDACINTKGEQLITMDAKEFAPFLMQMIPAIQLLNINIQLPKSLQQILKPRTSIRLKQKSEGQGFLRLDKLLDFDWQIAIGDAVIGESEFKKLLKNSENLIKYKSQYIYVSAGELEKLQKHFSSSKNLSAFEMLRAALSNEYYGAKISMSDEVRKQIQELTSQKEIPLPQNLQAQLRPYQQRGYSWMYRNTQIGFGSLIADDMGLGKTLQVIATLLKYKEEGVLQKEKVLIVTPTGLLTNWMAEFEKFAPTLQCKLYHGSTRKIDKKENFDILLTSYGVVRTETDSLKKMKWHVVVIDEAQNIKNHETAQSKAIKSIPANTFIAMSGTPVENRLSELWNLMDFSNRGFLGTLSEFKTKFSNPIQNQNDISVANTLKMVTAPFMMRRLKSDKSIISDLPDKIEMDCFGYLAKEQASLYEKVLHEAMKEIEGIDTTDRKSLFVRQGLVLQMILALKQICNHPALFLKNNSNIPELSGKMDLLFDKLESIVESNEKVLLFTQFAEMGYLLQRFIAERFGDVPLFYHGGCTIKKRTEMVNTFQNNRVDKIFILSLKAAGTGLNLTAANHVIHYDLWWNPAVEAQATDRAYRIGQKSNVMVHRFITKGTFEERINEMIQSKKALANLTVATGENWIGNLSNKELRGLFERE